jgi:hypothetical protein
LSYGAKPYHGRPYSCTTVAGSDYKKEVKVLTVIDVFSKISGSEWAAPTFVQAKKTGDVCILPY